MFVEMNVCFVLIVVLCEHCLGSIETDSSLLSTVYKKKTFLSAFNIVRSTNFNAFTDKDNPFTY